MTHEIEGNYAFFNQTPAWHELGTVLQAAPTIKEAWKLAYPHSLNKLKIFTSEGQAIADYSAVIRDDGKQIGIVGNKHELVQPIQALEFFHPFLKSKLVELEAGGSLREGTRMWALAKLKDQTTEVIKNDAIAPYLLVFTSFDGSLAHGIQFTPIRVVCANTLRAAMGTNSGYRLRHTHTIHTKILDAQSAIMRTIVDFKKSIEAYKQLAATPVLSAEIKQYVEQVFEIDSTNQSTRSKNQIDFILSLAEQGRGLNLVPEARGTMWGAYNAVTEYLQHEYGNSADSRVNNLWFGPGAALSIRALNLALAH